MKSTTLCLIIFITTLAVVSNNGIEDYSIDTFITSLKDEGLFDIIKSIKKGFGQDVAIITCEELNKNRSGNCKRVVKDYILGKVKAPIPRFMKSSIYTQFKDKKRVESFNNILTTKFSSEKAKSISERIIEKTKHYRKK